jgi:hypothetical protein
MKYALTLVMVALFARPAFAIHIYANYKCQNKNFELNYDGPGSNYAFGGFSHLYSRGVASGERMSALAYELQSQDQSTVGESIGGESLDVIFVMRSYKKMGHGKSNRKAGDSCTPDEIDYKHTEWASRRTIKIKQISPEAAAKFGLKRGDKINLKCEESEDQPLKCPSSGKYTGDDFTS